MPFEAPADCQARRCHWATRQHGRKHSCHTKLGMSDLSSPCTGESDDSLPHVQSVCAVIRTPHSQLSSAAQGSACCSEHGSSCAPPVLPSGTPAGFAWGCPSACSRRDRPQWRPAARRSPSGTAAATPRRTGRAPGGSPGAGCACRCRGRAAPPPSPPQCCCSANKQGPSAEASCTACLPHWSPHLQHPWLRRMHMWGHGDVVDAGQGAETQSCLPVLSWTLWALQGPWRQLAEPVLPALQGPAAVARAPRCCLLPAV